MYTGPAATNFKSSREKVCSAITPPQGGSLTLDYSRAWTIKNISYF
jgi:hypothetical protein